MSFRLRSPSATPTSATDEQKPAPTEAGSSSETSVQLTTVAGKRVKV